MEIEIKKTERSDFRKRVRWQDWTHMFMALWLIVSPWAMHYTINEVATANARGVGIGIIIFNLMSVCRAVDQGQEIVNVLIGAWLILSPYALNFQSETAITTNCIGVGTLIIILAIWEMFSSAKIGR